MSNKELKSVHQTVLLEEAVKGLKIRNGSVVVDATLGGGGHSELIVENILPDGKLIAIDRDEKAILRFQRKIDELKTKKDSILLVNRNFSEIKDVLDELKIEKVDAILADFGLSSDQLNDGERGFSFLKEGGLDMRMDQKQELSAFEVVNEYSQEKLEELIRVFGDEKFSRRIAKNIVESRKKISIQTTKELSEIVERSVPEKLKRRGINPATKTFQAIRMEVNDELGSIRKFVSGAIEKLDSGGRLAVISFHSGEDRLVKDIFRKSSASCVCPVNFPVCTCNKKPTIKLVTRKPVIPSDEEIERNPRSRSAKMRIIEKL